MVISNHIHLLVLDEGERDVIPRSIQMAAGRSGKKYNIRKSRKGAFWEDRYHATAIESGDHLLRCIVYMDLNMVRAGVVNHPSEWMFGGYNEIQNPRRKCALIAYDKLQTLLTSPRTIVSSLLTGNGLTNPSKMGAADVTANGPGVSR